MSLLRLLQGCSQVSVRAVFSYRKSVEGICLLAPTIIDSTSFLSAGELMKACFFKASGGETLEQVC